MTHQRVSRVLIVDYEPVVAETLALVFSLAGYETKTCDSGVAALAKAMEWPPDLAVLDLLLKDMLGSDCAIQLSRNHPECRFILLYTARLPADIIEKADQLGWLVFSKPVGPALLLAAAQKLLESQLAGHKLRGFALPKA